MHSMTGFGTARFNLGEQAVVVEVRSLNHRSLEVRTHLPPALSFCEPAVREVVRDHVHRGRIDVSLWPAEGDTGLGRPVVHRALAAALRDEALQLIRPREYRGIAEALAVTWALQFPGVVGVVPPEWDREEVTRAVAAGVERAVRQLVASRAREGAALRRDIAGRIDRISELTESIRPLLAEQPRQQFERLRRRLDAWRAEGLDALDASRLAQEAAVLADRADATEELTRLCAHVEQFRTLLEGQADEPLGKRLQFLVQEMHREANTMAAKATDARVSRATVDLRSEIERIREQLANVE